MLTLLLILFLAFTVVSIIMYAQDTVRNEGWLGGIFIDGIITAILLGFVIWGACELATGKRLTQKIDMYTEENAKIELQVTTTVEKYLEHEYQIYDSLQGEDIQTLLVVYPEINSNELVRQQIEIFIANNKKIKKLKNDKINLSVWKFLIYFGN